MTTVTIFDELDEYPSFQAASSAGHHRVDRLFSCIASYL